jgi:hypothetical protein
MSTEDLLGQLQAYALSTKNPTVELHQFLRTLPQGRLSEKEVEKGVKELAFKGAFSMEAEQGRLLSISFPDLPLLALLDEYRRLAQDPARAFPREETAPIPIAPAEIMTMDAKSRFGELFEGADTESPMIVKLVFPENVPPLLVPRGCAGTDLLDAAVSRISRWLQDMKNSSYAESKLLTLLRGNEVTARQALEDLTLRPRKAAATILSPTEFSLRFWNHLSNVLIQDIGRKTELSEMDKGILQSACIVVYTAFHQKGVAQREAERAADRKALEQQVRRAPFVFGYQDLYLLRDEKGVSYAAKHSREFLHEFLSEALQKKDESSLPWILRLHHSPTSRDYFVQRDMLAPVFLKKLTDAADSLRVSYVKEWVEQMKLDRDPPLTRTDPAFRADLETRVRDQFPILASLANGPILYAVLHGTQMDDETRQELSRCFTARGALRPVTVLLGLTRAQLLREARSYLPFWQTIPFFRAIVRFLRRLTARRAAGTEASDKFTPAWDGSRAAGTARVPARAPQESDPARPSVDRQAMQRYQKSIRALIAAYVPAGKKVDTVLAELVERWNPLLEPGPKQDLVHDVNALVQDFVRPIRRTFIMKPPDLGRVKSLAEQLSASKSLAKIRKREPLIRYIELFALKTLLG